MSDGKSTRLAIVEKSIEDILDRLSQLPSTARVRELIAKAKVYERAVKLWPAQPPSEEQRSAMLKVVIELNVEVMQLGKEENLTRKPA